MLFDLPLLRFSRFRVHGHPWPFLRSTSSSIQFFKLYFSHFQLMKGRKLLLPISIHLNLHCLHLFSQFPILLNSLIIMRHGDDVGLCANRRVQRILNRERHPLGISHSFDPLSIVFISRTVPLTKMLLVSPTNVLPGLHSFFHLPSVGGYMIKKVFSNLRLLRRIDESISISSPSQDGIIIDPTSNTHEGHIIELSTTHDNLLVFQRSVIPHNVFGPEPHNPFSPFRGMPTINESSTFRQM